MSKRYKKLIALGLCIVTIATSTGAGIYSVTAKNTTQTQQTTVEESDTASQSDEDETVTKDETVYVIAGSDGSADKIIVSDWIKNAMKEDSITDSSEAENIKSASGTTYSLNSDNAKVWDTAGNDVYYTGDIEKELPVNLKVSYQLDGEDISAEDLVGKSGRVTIRFDYENTQTKTVTVNGKKETMYVPFVMLTGTILDNEIFSNVEVSNGKLINDGSRTIVAGFALPGLQEDLDLDRDKVDLPDYVEISADVENFEMQNTLTLATNEVFSDVDTDKLDDVDDLQDSLDQLTDAMDQLMDGSSQLYDGLSTLLDKSNTLIKGVDKLATGAKKLDDGTKTLADGTDTLYNQVHNKLYKSMPTLVKGVSDLNNGAKSASTGAKALAKGTTSLSKGLDKLTTYNDSLNSGAKKVFNTLLTTANSQLTTLADYGLEVPTLTIDNYSEKLTSLVTTLQSDAFKAKIKAKVQAEVNANESKVRAQVEANKDAIKAQVRQSLKETYGEENVTEEMVEAATQTTIDATVKSTMDGLVETNYTSAMEKVEEAAKQLQSLKSSLDEYNTFYTGIADYTDGVSSAAKGAKTIDTNMQTLSSGLQTLYKGTKSLQSGSTTLNTGVKTLDQGVKKLDQGADTLESGMDQLYNGIFKLNKSTPALKTGVGKLKDGAMQLSDGLEKFNKEGIEKLVDLVEDDVEDLVDRAKVAIDLAKDYESFSGLSDDMTGKVNFIYETDAITKED